MLESERAARCPTRRAVIFGLQMGLQFDCKVRPLQVSQLLHQAHRLHCISLALKCCYERASVATISVFRPAIVVNNL